MARPVRALHTHSGAILLGISMLGTAWGAGLGQDVRVNPLDVMTIRQERPALAISGSRTYAAWMDYRDGVWDLYLARSDDGGQTFGPNRRVDGTAAPRDDPGSVSMAAGAGNSVFLAWTGFHAGRWDLYLSRSTDGGLSFASRVAVDPAGAASRNQQRPALAVDPAGNLLVAWQDDRSGNWDIRCARSSDGGQGFGPSVRVDHTGAGASDQVHPRLAADNQSRLHVTWQDRRAGSWDVYTSRSLDAAASFLPDVLVDTAAGILGDQTDPDIAIDGSGAPQVVWQDDRSDPDADAWRIYRARSLDGGQSFEPAVLVPDGSGALDLTRPALSFGASGELYLGFEANTLQGYRLLVQRSDADGSNPGNSVDLGPMSEKAVAAGLAIGAGGSVAVIWEQAEDAVFARSTNGGANFSSARRVNDNAEDPALFTVQIHPDVALGAGGAIHVVWAESPSLVEDPEWEILLASSHDGGRSFGQPVRVNSVTTTSDVYFPSPSLAVAPDGKLFVAWEDYRSGGWEIYVARSLDGGSSFGQNLKLNAAPPVQDYPDGGPSLAVAPDGVVYVAWTDSRQVFQSGYDIYLALSTDGGASFLPDIRVDDATGGPTDQVFPALAATAGGRVFIAWQDGREGDDDIYFSRSLDGGLSFQPSLRVNETELPSDAIDQQSPSLALGAAAQVFVAWSDNREGPFASHIYVARSTDAGASFRRSVQVDDPNGETVDQRAASLAADASGKVAVAWQDARDVIQEDLDVYLAISTDAGASFAPDQRVDGTLGMRSAQETPDLALDAGGHPLAAWGDDRNLGNRDIYFATTAPPIELGVLRLAGLTAIGLALSWLGARRLGTRRLPIAQAAAGTGPPFFTPAPPPRSSRTR